MSNYPMVTELNRLIGDRLASGSEIFLPGVGSLYTERCAARRISRNEIVPPYRIIGFSSRERGVSIVGQLMRDTDCDEAQAQEIYNRWLDKTRQDDTLVIEGVGTLKLKSFVIDPEFEKRLNPQGHTPIRVKSNRSDWVIWCGAAAIAVALGIGIYQYAVLQPAKMPQQRPASTATPVAESAPDLPATTTAPEDFPTEAADAPTAETPATATPAAETPAAAVPAPAGQPAADAPRRDDEPHNMISGHRYVVLGVFSTPENAARAARQYREKDPDMQCEVLVFGSKFMLSPFHSASADDCSDYIARARQAHEGLWIYTAR